MHGEASTIKGVIRSLEGTQAVVEVEHGGCGRCHEPGGCGGQQLTQMFCSGPKTYLVENTCGAAVGERVTIAIAAGTVARTANLAYGTPLLGAIAGALAGTAVGGDLGGMIGAATGLVAAYIFIRRHGDRNTGNSASHPHIVSRS